MHERCRNRCLVIKVLNLEHGFLVLRLHFDENAAVKWAFVFIVSLHIILIWNTDQIIYCSFYRVSHHIYPLAVKSFGLGIKGSLVLVSLLVITQIRW